MTQLTRIEGMPTGQGSWYLGWIGDLKYNVSVPGEMTINVVVSPIIDDKGELLRRGNIDWSQSRIVPVSIAAIPYLEIGSIWRNGRMVSNHKTYNKQISANIFNYKCYFTTAGELWKEREGFDRNPSTLTRYLLDSPVYVVPTKVQGEPIDYYFPCSEIFRFFYAVSSPFVRLLFESATSSSFDPMRAFYKSIEEKQAIDISINDVITTAVIELTKHAYDADAPTIAEFALSIFAQEELRGFFKRLSKQALQDTSKYLQIRPPFGKSTHLKFNCRPLNFKENKSYLVEKIISYRHPFFI